MNAYTASEWKAAHQPCTPAEAACTCCARHQQLPTLKKTKNRWDADEDGLFDDYDSDSCDGFSDAVSAGMRRVHGTQAGPAEWAGRECWA